MRRHFAFATLSLAVLFGGACQPRTAGTPAPEQSPATSASTVPSAREIIDRHLRAIGGRDVLRNVRSIRMTSTLSFSGISGQMTAYTARPNKLLVITSLPGMGEIRTGYDGQVAWSIDPVQGPRLLTGRELEEMAERARFDAMMKDSASYRSIETIGRSEFEGRPVWEIRVVRPSGREETEYYDAETGLQIGQITTQSSAMGQVQVTSVMSDYRQFGPMLAATKSVQRLGPQEISITVDTIEYDVVPDSIFALPAQIRALTGNR